MTFLKFDPMRHFDDIASKFETALNQACDELMEKGFVKAEDIKKNPFAKTIIVCIKNCNFSDVFLYFFTIFECTRFATMKMHKNLLKEEIRSGKNVENGGEHCTVHGDDAHECRRHAAGELGDRHGICG